MYPRTKYCPERCCIPDSFLPFLFFLFSLLFYLLTICLPRVRQTIDDGEICIDYFDSCNLALRERIIWKQYSWIIRHNTCDCATLLDVAN